VAILPDGTLRDFSTSFTEVTESPFTPAEGHTGMEIAGVSASTARLDTMRAQGINVSGLGITRGLPHRWAIGVSLDAWSGLGLTTGPVSGETSPGGFGGGTVSARHTFFGVDSAGAALGVLASLGLPGSASSPVATAYGAAVALPFAATLPGDVTFGAMAEAATVPDAGGAGRHLRFVDSVKLDRDLVPRISAWLEVVSIVDRESGAPWLATMNGGLSAELGKHIGVSLGAAAGHARRTMDHGFFGGVSVHV